MDNHTSHSAASSSATSSFHKRKLPSDDHAPPVPPSFSGETISTRGGANSESDESEFDNSSMRNFTKTRLENNVLRNSNSVKIEVAKDGVKEDENLETSGAYSAREESLKREEEAGRLKFVCVSNDDNDEHMVWYQLL